MNPESPKKHNSDDLGVQETGLLKKDLKTSWFLSLEKKEERSEGKYNKQSQLIMCFCKKESDKLSSGSSSCGIRSYYLLGL